MGTNLANSHLTSMATHITHAQEMAAYGAIMLEHGVTMMTGRIGTIVQVVRVSITNHYIKLAFNR